MWFITDIAHYVSALVYPIGHRSEIQKASLKTLALVSLADGILDELERDTVAEFVQLKCKSARIDGKLAIEFYTDYLQHLETLDGTEYEQEVQGILDSFNDFPIQWREDLYDFSQRVVEHGGVTEDEASLLARLRDGLILK